MEMEKRLLPIQDLFKPDFTIFEGHNRHEALMRIMESLIARNSGILSLRRNKTISTTMESETLQPTT